MASMTPAQDPATALAIDEPLAATLDRWRKESAALDRAGVYDLSLIHI